MHPWQVFPVMLIALPAAAEPVQPEVMPLPSKAQLEFLSEWQDVDEETFQLLLENGIRDAEQPPVNEEKRHD